MSGRITVTGALGYSGRAITERLIARGCRVGTLTNSPDRPNPFGTDLEIHPLAFDHPDGLAESLRGTAVLVNTYWVRFNHRSRRAWFTHDQAVENTRRLFDAARSAGVERIVHVSILNPSGTTESAGLASSLSYYAGKHQLEEDLRQTGLSHAVVRPGVLFGRNDILVNNIAWVLRHLPAFGLFDGGGYGIRPMHVDDFADLIVERVFDDRQSVTDAVGPERFEFRDMVRLIADILGVRRLMLPVPNAIGHAACAAISPFLGDVILTRDEIRALTAGLLDSSAETDARIGLSDWVRQNADTLGRRYNSEIARRTDRSSAYTHVA